MGNDQSDETVTPDSLSVRVKKNDSDAILALKTTYHPNWHVTVDGHAENAFMLSPSYIGVALQPGMHLVKAEYKSSVMKKILLLMSSITSVISMLEHRSHQTRQRSAPFSLRTLSGEPHSGALRPPSQLLRARFPAPVRSRQRGPMSIGRCSVFAEQGRIVLASNARAPLHWRQLPRTPFTTGSELAYRDQSDRERLYAGPAPEAFGGSFYRRETGSRLTNG